LENQTGILLIVKAKFFMLTNILRKNKPIKLFEDFDLLNSMLLKNHFLEVQACLPEGRLKSLISRPLNSMLLKNQFFCFTEEVKKQCN
jgi:hypothetical protein